MPAIARARFESAINRLVDDLKRDDEILAAVLCGSLAHDEVWDRSDIDLVLVSTDDRKTPAHSICLLEDDIYVHANVMPRAEFRVALERAVRNTFMHSLFAKGRLLYTHDASITRLLADLHKIGDPDAQVQLMRSAIGAVSPLNKAHKWFTVHDDLDYTAMWVLRTAEAIAEIELGLAGRLVGREALPDATQLNPALFAPIYSRLLNTKKTRSALAAALATLDGYLEPKAARLFAPVLAYLGSSDEPRSATEIEHHCDRHFQVHGVLTACEWLADIGVLQRMSVSAKLTRRSKLDVEEAAFFYAKR